jgi:hypothetical protein
MNWMATIPFGIALRFALATIAFGDRAGMGNESDQVSEGQLVDALACTGDEGRDTLRKATGRCEYPLIRGYPNGETHLRCL